MNGKSLLINLFPMNGGKKLYGIVVFLFLLSGTTILAQQTSQPVSSLYIKNQLDKIYGLDQRLISGKSYPGEVKGSIAGSPYWVDSEWKLGSVDINGVRFTNLLLKFDIVEDILVLNTSNLNKQTIQVCLNMNSISEFYLGEKKFIKFPVKDDSTKELFCQVCAEGKLSYLVTKSKTLAITSESATSYKYNEQINNYLLYEGRLIKFKGKRTIYKLFPELKQDIRKFSYQNALTMPRKNIVNRAILVEYCNQLIDQS